MRFTLNGSRQQECEESDRGAATHVPTTRRCRVRTLGEKYPLPRMQEGRRVCTREDTSYLFGFTYSQGKASCNSGHPTMAHQIIDQDHLGMRIA